MKYGKIIAIICAVCVLCSACAESVPTKKGEQNGGTPKESDTHYETTESAPVETDEKGGTESGINYESKESSPTEVSEQPAENSAGYEISELHLSIENHRQDRQDPLVSISVSYPEVVGLEDPEISEKVNRALSFYTLHTRYDIQKWDRYLDDLLSFRGYGYYNEDTQISYEILAYDLDRLSVHYEEIRSFNRVNKNSYYLTFDMTTGEMMSVFEVIELSDLQDRIRSGDYTVLEGTYLPDGWNGTEDWIKTDFIGLIQEMYDSRQTGTDEADEANEVYYGMDNNFGIDETGLYLSFYYMDSLHGYVTLFFEGEG